MSTFANHMSTKEINIIKPIGGLVAGQKKTYELWVTGSIISITNEEEVKKIERALKDARKMEVNEKEYLWYQIVYEGLLNE